MKETSQVLSAASSQPTSTRASYQTPQLEQHRAWQAITLVQSVPFFTSQKYWFDGQFWSANDPWNTDN